MTNTDVITFGHHVYERLPDGANWPMRGGLVLDVAERPDTETGEIRRVFTVLTFPHGKSAEIQLTEDQIDPSLVERARVDVVRDAARRLEVENATAKGAVTMEEIRRAEIADRLYGLLAGHLPS